MTKRPSDLTSRFSSEFLKPFGYSGSNTQSDWDESDNSSYAYIRNKPVLDPSRWEKEVIDYQWGYGYLYNWYAAVDPKNIGNALWSVPETGAVWATLENYLVATYPEITTANSATHLMSKRMVSSPLGGEWATSVHPRWNYHATRYGLDTFNFSALPSGTRSIFFNGLGASGDWWTKSTSGIYANRALIYPQYSGGLYENDADEKYRGHAIRLYRPATVDEQLLSDGTYCADYIGNDGKTYRTVKIGTQVWLAANLAETKYNDGTDIVLEPTQSTWNGLTSGARCAYSNNQAYVTYPYEVELDTHIRPKESKKVLVEHIDGVLQSDWTETEVTSLAYIKNKPASFESVIDVTYSELVSAIASSGLNKGSFYRITDFATVHYIMVKYLRTDNINVGTTEPLIVLATNTNEISNQAYSEQYPQDVIYYDWNPDNWILDLSFANAELTLGTWGTLDTSAVSIVSGFKGVIYFRHDLKNDNSTGYDFRNVRFRRWAIPAFIGYSPYYALQSTTPGVVDSLDYLDLLTFNCPLGEEQYERQVFGNHIKSYRDNYVDLTFSGTSLPCTVFNLSDAWNYPQVVSNTFGQFCLLNTFDADTLYNKIGDFCVENVTAGAFESNYIKDSFLRNTVKNLFRGNIIGNNFKNNITGNRFQNNIIKNGLSASEGFSNNNIGTDFENNWCWGRFNYNTIKNNVENNRFSGMRMCEIGTYMLNNEINNINYIKTPDKIFSTAFRNNVVKDITGSIGSLYDFSAATHVFTDYLCNIFLNAASLPKLTYLNASDELVVTNAND